MDYVKWGYSMSVIVRKVSFTSFTRCGLRPQLEGSYATVDHATIALINSGDLVVFVVSPWPNHHSYLYIFFRINCQWVEVHPDDIDDDTRWKIRRKGGYWFDLGSLPYKDKRYYILEALT